MTSYKRNKGEYVQNNTENKKKDRKKGNDKIININTNKVIIYL